MTPNSRLSTATTLLMGCLSLALAPAADAACGCDKPAPPRASVRPFAGAVDQTITLFDDRFEPRELYTVTFRSRDGREDWSRARGAVRRDFADGLERPQLRVGVGNVGFGPATITVQRQDGTVVTSLADDLFTVIAPPIVLHDFTETVARDGYQTGVGADGTVYVAIDTSDVADATTYTGVADGFPLRFDAGNVAFFNAQGFLMGFLDGQTPGLFSIGAPQAASSAALRFWRHEFRTYKQEHRKRDERRSADGEWHVDGTPHVDNYHMLVAVSGVMPDGNPPVPGATPPFRLTVTSAPSEVPNAQ